MDRVIKKALALAKSRTKQQSGDDLTAGQLRHISSVRRVMRDIGSSTGPEDYYSNFYKIFKK